MQKTYDSVGWKHLRNSLVRIKMCSKFIQFFGGVYGSHTNRIMTNFGLTSGYHVHDGLDQGEVFSSLLWQIFYDPLLCEVKRQESVCGYRLNSHFISRTGCVESQAGLTSFLAAGAFVDDTIWTVTIPINCWIANLSLLISEMPISVAKKRESYWYLGIFLFTEGFSKLSLAKAYLDIKFFANLVLKKAISNKQFLYLVSSVLHPIVNYRTQFSFVSPSMYNKWDTIIRKSLKSKSGLPLDFSNNALHHLSLYGLKTFEQIQTEHKVVSVVCFANSVGILGHLFAYRSYDFKSRFVRCLLSLRCYGVAFVDQLQNRSGTAFTWTTFKCWKWLDSYLIDFATICDCLLGVNTDSILVYTDDSLAGLGTVGMQAGAAIFFDGVDLGLGVEVSGLVSSLECVSPFSSVHLFSDNQAALNACKSKLVKGHSGVVGNKHADALATAAAMSEHSLSLHVNACYILAGGVAVSGNSRHFVHDIFHCVHRIQWEIGLGSRVLVTSLHDDVDWCRSSLVWHPDMHMAAGSTDKCSAGVCTYFMKALHHQLPVAVCKCLYSRSYPSVLCLYCGEVKVSDHVFSCGFDTAIHAQLLDMYAAI
ncbi:hypothetical protein G9A89_022921 [Geosiphon pyriformis]|nr:hypothetical protein G9A89_022921 [Geosiphon pyriformis]